VGAIWDADRALLLAINGSWGGGWDTFWWTVSQIWCWVPLEVAMLALVWHRFGWRKMLIAVGLVILGLALADQTANFFKLHTPKLRPSRTEILWDGQVYNSLVHIVKGYRGGLFGTVSGHAATSMVIAVISAGIYRRRWFSLVMAMYVVLTCFSRLYLGVHFPLDILFGLATGSLWGVLILWLWRVINKKLSKI
ncbi:MAG: phosphatase PAP2 family protein, partial [Rikenellaceae bacterium]|nr:phosphatase PAP2 family protein [Rikenellaceae bacterium]